MPWVIGGAVLGGILILNFVNAPKAALPVLECVDFVL